MQRLTKPQKAWRFSIRQERRFGRLPAPSKALRTLMADVVDQLRSRDVDWDRKAMLLEVYGLKRQAA